MKPGETEAKSSRPRQIRVLMLLENCAYSTDGRVQREANSLAAAGYRVTVICPKRRGERRRETFGSVVAYQYPPPPSANGVIGYVIEYGYALVATAIISLWVAFRQGFDVVHTHNPPDIFVLITGIYRLFGKRIVFDHHDLAADMYRARFTGPGNPLIHRALLFFERMSCRWAHHVITTNESYKQVDIERAGIPASRITVVRNGPESQRLKLFESNSSRRDDPRIVIGYVGVMGYQDGVDYLLRALHLLKFELGRTDWRSVLIGSGDAMESLKQTALDLEIADQIHFTGWVEYEKVPPFIGETDICVAPDPSTFYNDRSTLIKVMEYMGQAKPVVAFDLPENRVTAGDTALYATANDERDLSRNILRLMDDAGLRQSLGQAGRRRVLEQFTWKHQEPHLLEAYRCMLSDEPARQFDETERCENLITLAQRCENNVCVTD